MYLLPLKFKLIPIGSWFRFESETRPWPHNGMERGPWQKVSERGYLKRGKRAMQCRVGSGNVLVVAAYDVEVTV